MVMTLMIMTMMPMIRTTVAVVQMLTSFILSYHVKDGKCWRTNPDVDFTAFTAVDIDTTKHVLLFLLYSYKPLRQHK